MQNDMNAVSLEEIAQFYQAILGREIDAEARRHFEQVGTNALSRAKVLHLLVSSAEFKARSESDQRAARTHFPELSNLDQSSIIEWFHSFEFPDGTRVTGTKSLQTLQAEADAIFRHGVKDRRVLDIGAWDGFFSFEAERRGARSVLSTDWFCWGGPGWGTKAGYDYAHRKFSSRCEQLEIDLFDLDPVKHGTFDVVLFLGVLYHLPDPLGGLRKAAAMASGQLIVESATSHNRETAPLLRYLPNRSLGGDPTNFFAPNVACIKAMLEDLGFTRVEVLQTPSRIPGWNFLSRRSNGHMRHVVYAWR